MLTLAFTAEMLTDTGAGPSSGLVISNAACSMHRAPTAGVPHTALPPCITGPAPRSRNEMMALTDYSMQEYSPKAQNETAASCGCHLNTSEYAPKYPSTRSRQRETNRRRFSEMSTHREPLQLHLLHVPTYRAALRRLAGVEQAFAILSMYQESVSIPLSLLLTLPYPYTTEAPLSLSLPLWLVFLQCIHSSHY